MSDNDLISRVWRARHLFRRDNGEWPHFVRLSEDGIMEIQRNETMMFQLQNVRPGRLLFGMRVVPDQNVGPGQVIVNDLKMQRGLLLGPGRKA